MTHDETDFIKLIRALQTLLVSLLFFAFYGNTDTLSTVGCTDSSAPSTANRSIGAVTALVFSPKSIARQPLKRRVKKTGVKQTSLKKPAVKPKPKKGTKQAIRRVQRQKNPAPARTTTGRRPLSGTVFYLASGHGGPDPGAIGRYGRYLLPEDEYAYDVTIRLAQQLKQLGATVYMIVQDPNDGIRNDAVLKLDNDEVVYPHQSIVLNHTNRLNQTTSAVNRLYARYKKAYQRLITIHVDSRSRGQTIDVFFYYHTRSAVGRRLAEHIHQRFKTNYRRYQPARPYSGNVSTRNSLYVVRNSQAPTVFIELGNIQNAQDQRRFLLASNRQALASWMAQGILDDYRSR